MARQRKTKVADAPQVVGSTFEETKKLEERSDTVTISVSLRNGHKFTDIPNGMGGVKTVHLVGLDDHLRGAREGILAPDGNAKFQTLNRTDWENILQIHGKETMFTGRNGFAPCVFEVVGGLKNAKSFESQIKETSTGFAPIDVSKVKAIETAD